MFARPSKIHEIETAKKWLITALVVQNSSSSSSSIEDFGVLVNGLIFFLIVLTFIDFAYLINDDDDLQYFEITLKLT